MGDSNGEAHGETTKEVILDRLDGVEKHAKRFGWLFGIIATLVTMGFSAGTYLFLTFARADDVESLHARMSKSGAAVQEIKTDVAVLKATTSRIEDDYRWIREQTTEIARSVRARVVVQPTHSMIGPAR